MVTGDEGHEGRWCKRDEEKEEWRPGEAPAPDKADQQGAPDEQNPKGRRDGTSPHAINHQPRAGAERLLVLSWAMGGVPEVDECTPEESGSRLAGQQLLGLDSYMGLL